MPIIDPVPLKQKMCPTGSPGSEGLWVTAQPLSRLGQDPFATCGHGRGDQCGSDRRLAGGSASGQNTNLSLCSLTTQGGVTPGEFANSIRPYAFPIRARNIEVHGSL